MDELIAGSGTLRQWWSEHGVQILEPCRKRIVHAQHGPLELLQTQTQLAHQPSLRLRLLVPADERTRTVLATARTAD